MKKITAALRKEYQSELDKFYKLHSDEKAAYIVLAVVAVAFALSGHAYDVGEYLGSKIGSLIG